MSDNNFEKEFESASQDLMNQPVVDNLEPEMQEQLRQIEALAGMDPSFANSKEYQDLVSSLVNSSNQASDDDEDEDDEEDDDGKLTTSKIQPVGFAVSDPPQ